MVHIKSLVAAQAIICVYYFRIAFGVFYREKSSQHCDYDGEESMAQQVAVEQEVAIKYPKVLSSYTIIFIILYYTKLRDFVY